MTNRRTTVMAFAAAALISLLLPAAASAQQGPWWGQGRRGDDYGRNGRLGDHDRRRLRELARRIDERAASFQRNIDRALDRSRIDDTPREDNINDRVRAFRRAAERFRDRAGDSSHLGNSQNEARQLLSEAGQIDRVMRRIRVDGRAQSDWSQIRADLRTVADFYGLRVGDFDDDYYRRGRRSNTGPQWPRNWPRPF